MMKAVIQSIGGVVMAMVLAVSAWGAEEAKPATQPTTQPAARSAMEIVQELNATGGELRGLLGPKNVRWMQAQSRAEVAPAAIPLMRKMVGGFGELFAVEPAAKEELGVERLYFLALLSLARDASATQTLEQMAGGKDVAEAVGAKGMQLLTRWWRVGLEAEGQGKVLDELQALAKANPEQDALASAVVMMFEAGIANEALFRQAQAILADDLKGPVARELAKPIASARKLAGLKDKPLVIEGTTVEGSKFSTANWKGKVIVVDFWATWCPGCQQILPHIARVYQTYRDKGLEVVGISADQRLEQVAAYVKAEKLASWPSLFDRERPGMAALMEKYGIAQLPTVFVIDRKGVVRSVDAIYDLEETVVKLLAEPQE